MRKAFDDVSDACLLVIDLEWVGNSFTPQATHIFDIACYNPRTNDRFCAKVKTLTPLPPIDNAMSITQMLRRWLAWLDVQSNGPIMLIAHNGIRFDGPVLRSALHRCGLPVPTNVCIMDSLYHLRHHLRYRVPKTMKYDIDSICAYCQIDVDAQQRHTALYDAMLLTQILQHFENLDIPFISGHRQPLATLSTMLVHGVGPSVAKLLPQPDLLALCEQILLTHADLSTASCLLYLQSLPLQKQLPLCNLDAIAKSIEPAAKRHLQYLENGT